MTRRHRFDDSFSSSLEKKSTKEKTRIKFNLTEWDFPVKSSRDRVWTFPGIEIADDQLE